MPTSIHLSVRLTGVLGLAILVFVVLAQANLDDVVALVQRFTAEVVVPLTGGSWDLLWS